MFYNALTMSGIFFIISFIFLIFRDKAYFLIGGYNCITKAQRKNYDEKKLSKDFGTTFLNMV
ncbi:DUF3784 domain-containing protein [Romboutsia sp. 1001713B170131_170501_G6]|uniref:DUF3784 domain-containing protein n=1 Tax=Romboutsia sp. 1001713B170131_170501_G6 TaxID=2787108 RepID=UPI0018A8D82C|nr:DUF3784 domain-containing protein [Romboutsia sp. 1001713B170131_170501_G6]